ncbi:hypothetical protein ACEWY4_001948 [Coilia grayii]|uniref:Uncharacterized protein n=1 Tax=Coilia grayii TaxID=363190 RepID=A0ABD1KUG1_9TELE
MTARHREVVRTARTGVTTGSLMDRFLQDVMRHHPYHYGDTRPSHADLPCLTTLPAPREELSEVYCGSKGDRASVGTRDEMPSSDDETSAPAPAQKAPAAKKKDAPAAVNPPKDKAVDTMPTTSTHSGLDSFNTHLNPPLSRKDSPTQGFMHRTSSTSLRTPSQSRCYSRHTTKVYTKSGSTQTPLPTEPVQSKAPTPTPEQPSNSQSQHRKAQKKTNRHGEENESASNSLAGAQTSVVPMSKAQAPAPSKPRFERPLLWTPAVPPWKSAHREHTFSDVSGQINQVIDEVIDTHCYGGTRGQKKQDDDDGDSDKGSFHVSLHSMSNSEGSKEWDDTLQVAPRAAKVEEKNLTGLMETHISLEDQMYNTHLDSALKPVGEVGDGTAGMEVRVEEEEEVLPDLPHIPRSFVGKTWTQVMQEKDQKIENMVKEFREGRFRSYFDTESLACYGKHRRKKKRPKTRDAEPQSKFDDVDVDGDDDGDDNCGEVLPLLEHSEEDVVEQQPQPPPVEETAQPQKRIFRLAARCQVVKVSHGTQTTTVSCPVVRCRTVEGVSAALLELEQQEEEELEQPEDCTNETPKLKTGLNALSLPSFYSKVMSPLQPKTVVYVLSSPADTLASISKQPGKRRPGGGRKKKVCNIDNTHKYKYKKNPLKYYDPLTNQILKSPPKGAPSTSNPKYHPHVRQLFRSLSPDNNKERCGLDFGNDAWGSQRGPWPGSSIADLCASSTGSCLDSAGPSEPGSSLSSSRRALFSRSSMCSSSRFLLGTLTSGPSITDSTAVAPSQTDSQASDHDEDASSGSHQAGSPRPRGRKRSGERARSPTPEEGASSPPSKRRKKTAAPKAKGKPGRPAQKAAAAPHPRKSTEGRTSPRGKAATRSSPRTPQRIQSHLRP